MANQLTGDYEAVVQVALRQINGLLATLHQNGTLEDAVLKLLHSVDIRVGDPPRPRPDLDVFRDWVLEYQQAGDPIPIGHLRDQLTRHAPPGAAKRLAGVFAGFSDVVITENPDIVRGRVKLQLSTLTLSIPEGSSGEVTIHAQVRAEYQPDPNTADLPTPIHGEVRIGFVVRKVRMRRGIKLLIQASPDNNHILFIPDMGAGIDQVEASRLSLHMRKLVRDGFVQLPVDLPTGFAFSEFKGVGAGNNAAVALPLSLSGGSLPTGAIHSITNAFLGPSGLGVAVSKEFVAGLIDIAAIQEAIKLVRIPLEIGRWGIDYTVEYRLRFTSGPSLTFVNGGIEIAGRVAVETGTWWAPNGFVRFKQLIKPWFQSGTGQMTLIAVGAPEVDESWFIPHGTAVNVVRTQIREALDANADAVRQVFDDASLNLNQGLKTFDDWAGAGFHSIDVTPHGIVVRGDLHGRGLASPVIHVAETNGGQAFTAFRSWIPGGTIERFIWSWIEYPNTHLPSIWFGVRRTLAEEHRFVIPKPPGITSVSQVCLRIEGTQIVPSGLVVPIAGGELCHVPEPEIIMEVPSWWEPVVVPVWMPGVAADAVIKDGIAAHVTVQGDGPGRDEVTRNTLVYFADWSSEEPLLAIATALEGSQPKRSALGVIVVVPTGAFDQRRRDIEAKLASLNQRVTVEIQLTEDHDSGWSKTFAVSTVPSTYLINGRREFVWQYAGTPDVAVLRAALAEHLLPPGGPRQRHLSLSVGVGDRAPDVVFQDADRDQFALHRLQGRAVLLNFWQSWSAPCLTELQRLQRLYDDANRDGIFVVAFHGGSDTTAIETIRKQFGLTFPLVQDTDQRIARRYGVRCWPTTVGISAQGRIDHIQFGVSAGYAAA